MKLASLAIVSCTLAPLAHPQEHEAAEAFVVALAGDDGKLSLAEVQRGLAEIEVSVALEREMQQADYRLEKLEKRVARELRDDPEDPDLREASVLVLLAHVKLQLERGLLDDAANEFEDVEVVGAGPHAPELVAEHAIATDPRVVELRAAVERLANGEEVDNEGGVPILRDLPLVGFRFQGDKVGDAVREALSNGDRQFIEGLGQRAAPALVEGVRAELDVLPRHVEQDALWLLAIVDIAAAGETMHANLDAGGFFWKKRVVRALEPNLAKHWNSAVFPPTYAVPEIATVIERLAEDPEVGNQALGLVGHFGTRAALTPGMQRVLAQALLSESPVRRELAMDQLHMGGMPPYNSPALDHAPENQRPILEAALESADPSVRTYAAERLTNLPWSDTLAEHANDPEARVRRAVVTMLSARQLHTHTSPSTLVNEQIVPEYGERERALLVRLLQDENAEIRAAALSCMDSFPSYEVDVTKAASGNPQGVSMTSFIQRVLDPLPDAVLLTLAQDEDATVRATLGVLTRSLDPDLAARILLRLAQDPDPVVVEVVDSQVTWLLPRQNPVAVLQVLRARAANQSVPLQPSRQVIRQVMVSLKYTAEGRELLARWVVEVGDPDLLAAFVRRFLNGHLYGVERALLGLAPATLRDVLVACDRFEGFEFYAYNLLEAGAPAESVPTLLELARDESLSIRLRAAAALGCAEHGGEAYVQAVHEILRDAWWVKSDAEWYLSALHKRLSKSPGRDYNAIALAVVLDSVVPERIASDIAGDYHSADPGGVEIARAILARWYDDPNANRGVVRRAVRHMGSSRELLNVELLQNAMFERTTYYARPAIEAVGKLRDPELFPLLERFIRNERTDLAWWEAVQATAGFLTDESAEVLLFAASVAPDDSQRNWCLATLESIREYHLAKDYWATRRAIDRSRDAAVVELFELLEDDSNAIRVQAIRALATFGAVEALPRLIRLLKDSDEDVRSAATRALERLNRVEEEAAKAAEDDEER